MTKKKRNEKADIKIRLTEALRAKIERSAKSRGVSMNADMIDRLERSFTDEQMSELKSKIDLLMSELGKIKNS